MDRVSIYKCEECHACFPHKYAGKRAYNICVNGGGTYSKEITGEYINRALKQLKENEGVSSKK